MLLAAGDWSNTPGRRRPYIRTHPRLDLLAYFLLWSYFVGSALISANGIALLALVPIFDNPIRAKSYLE